MKDKFFLGVADNNYSATAVIGDAQGKIFAANKGGSVNFKLHGLNEARHNLKELISGLIASTGRQKLELVSFTYKSNAASSKEALAGLLAGMLEDTEVQIKEFTTACTLGIAAPKARMLLCGGQRGLVVFDDFAGTRFRLSSTYLAQDLRQRIYQKLQYEEQSAARDELVEMVARSGWQRKREQIPYLSASLNSLVGTGNYLALEVAFDLACDFVRLVIKMAKHMRVSDPVIGLYGQLLLGCPVIYERVSYLVKLIYPQAQLAAAPLAPVKGAYLAGLAARRLKVDQEVITNLANTFGDLRFKNGLATGLHTH